MTCLNVEVEGRSATLGVVRVRREQIKIRYKVNGRSGGNSDIALGTGRTRELPPYGLGVKTI